MNTFKFNRFLGLLLFAFALVFSSCQGPLDDDISLLFDTFGEKVSVSATSTSSQNDSGQKAEDIYRKLIGKWILTKYTFIGESSDTYDEEDNYYVEFFPDFTAKIHPYYLFEAEKGNSSWTLVGTSIIMFDNDEDDSYSIMQLTSSSLVLGWLEDGKVVEITTFKKAK